MKYGKIVIAKINGVMAHYRYEGRRGTGYAFVRLVNGRPVGAQSVSRQEKNLIESNS